MEIAPIKAQIKPKIAISNRPFSSIQDLIDYCLKKECGIDYSFPYEARRVADLKEETVKVREIVKRNIEIRYHCPFYFVEIAQTDKHEALESLKFLKHCLDFTADFGGKYMTVHIGLNLKSPDKINSHYASAHLAELVDYGKRKGATVCLENLTKGLTNNPHSFRQIIDQTQAGVTFDLGHANACPWVREEKGSSEEFLRIFAPLVINAHVYEIEKIDEVTGGPVHVAPEDLKVIRPLLAGLLATSCDWWLIELKVLEQVEHTRILLQTFLEEALSSMNPNVA